MWAEVNGERKKVACGPCIRGHRSSKCDHRDRVLVEVRKPGRPLSSCPHPSGSCSCERVVINYTIPKSSECACPSDRAQPTAAVASSSRIQKNRRQSSVVNTYALERALQIGQDNETDTSSTIRTPTEGSPSNEASPPSSASSTPRILPAQKEATSSCCKPNAMPPPKPKTGCCCSKPQSQPQPQPQTQAEPQPEKVKSCCSGTSTSASTLRMPPAYQHFGQQFHFQTQPHLQTPPFQNFPSHASSPALLPYGLSAPIYSHAAAAYQERGSIPMGPLPPHPGPSHSQRVPEHNCRCGESCSCFGCAAHPNNATMMEYVRLMAQFQYTGGFGAMPPPLYDMPTYPHHPGFGAEANQAMNYGVMSQGTPTPTQLGFPTNMNLPLMNHASIPYSGPWQQPPLPSTTMPGPQYLEPGDYTLTSPVEGQATSKAEDTVATPIADSPSDGSREEDTSTLSPSSYFWNQMTLPGCSDATGTCQCGDGCACVGCLTHGGHNGVHLDDPVAGGEHDAFTEFAVPDSGLGNDEAAGFMPFHTGPT